MSSCAKSCGTVIVVGTSPSIRKDITGMCFHPRCIHRRSPGSSFGCSFQHICHTTSSQHHGGAPHRVTPWPSNPQRSSWKEMPLHNWNHLMMCVVLKKKWYWMILDDFWAIFGGPSFTQNNRLSRPKTVFHGIFTVNHAPFTVSSSECLDVFFAFSRSLPSTRGWSVFCSITQCHAQKAHTK